MSGQVTSNTGNINYLGLEERNPRETYVRRRAPVPQDFRGYKIGDRWIDKSTQAAYILVSKSGNISTWLLLGSGAGSLSSLTPDVGGAVLAVAGNINLPGFGGITTTNGGAGILDIEDRRWLSAYVVDPSAAIGTRGEYTTVQAAITAAAGAGGGTIYVRPGTYTENLVLPVSTLDIVACCVDGRPPSASVKIIGNHTYTGTGASFLFQGFSFSAPVGDIFTLTETGPGFSIFATKYCALTAAGGKAMVAGSGGGFMVPVVFSTQASGSTDCFEIQAGCLLQILDQSDLTANSGSGVNITGAGSQVLCSYSTIAGSNGGFTLNDASNVAELRYSGIGSTGNSAIVFGAAASVAGENNIYNSNAISGFYISGAGTYSGTNDVLTGTASSVDPATTVTPFKWRPRATAGTSVTAYAGTASFDQNDFTVTDGFVQSNGAASGTATTVGAVTADVITFSMGVTPLVREFDVIVAGFEGVTPAGAGYAVIGAVRTDGVTATLVGTPDVISNEEAALVLAHATIVVSGNNAVVQVTGVAGLTINWRATTRSIGAP